MNMQAVGTHVTFVKGYMSMPHSQMTWYQTVKQNVFSEFVITELGFLAVADKWKQWAVLVLIIMINSFFIKSKYVIFSQQGMYLRDVLDDLSRRKLRDVVDFEWKRNIRFYGTDNSKAPGECIDLCYDYCIKHERLCLVTFSNISKHGEESWKYDA